MKIMSSLNVIRVVWYTGNNAFNAPADCSLYQICIFQYHETGDDDLFLFVRILDRPIFVETSKVVQLA
jgi:hypothetical protein